MLKPITLTADIAAVDATMPGPALCVRHRAYATPITNALVVDFAEFALHPWTFLSSIEHLVVVGMNRIITPSNRTDEVFEVLHNLTPTLHKYSIDDTLFAGEPWRMWFHWGLCNAFFDGYTYSYLLESHWRAYLEGAHSNPLSIENVRRLALGIVDCRYVRWFPPMSVEVVPTSAEEKELYQELKEQCFAECTTAKAIIARLAAYAQNIVPWRRLPTFRTCLAEKRSDFVVTDLGVDRWLIERMREAIDLTDCLGGAT